MGKLIQMTVKELSDELNNAMADLEEATKFNDDFGSKRAADYAAEVVDELKRRGVTTVAVRVPDSEV